MHHTSIADGRSLVWRLVDVSEQSCVLQDWWLPDAASAKRGATGKAEISWRVYG